MFSTLAKNWKNGSWWKRIYTTKILKYILKNKGTYILDEDFDNLIILDACRYDVFKMLNTIQGKLEFRISRGSNTIDFLEENFIKNDVNCKDIIYVTASPWVSKLLKNKFFKIYPVWDYGWDNDLNTVPPWVIVKEAISAHKKYPNKKLIIHFIQPHAPFLELKIRGETGLGDVRNTLLNSTNSCDVHWWDLAEKGKINMKEVWRGYISNLLIVLKYVKNLLPLLSGTTVITSDHGNLFGVRPHILFPFKTYAHPSGLYVKQLVLVPWFKINQ